MPLPPLTRARITYFDPVPPDGPRMLQIDGSGVIMQQTPFGPPATINGPIVSQRSSDAHLFVMGHGNDYEFDPTLTLVNTFASTTPSVGPWDIRAMQFVNGFCYKTWIKDPDVVVQQCDPATLAVITSWTFSNPGTGTHPYPFGVSLDGAFAYFTSASGPAGQNNILWRRDLLGAVTAVFATFGAFNPATGTGYTVSNVGPLAAGGIVAYYIHSTGGATDDDAIARFDNLGVQQWAVTSVGFAPLFAFPPQGSITITDPGKGTEAFWLGSNSNPGYVKSFLTVDGSAQISGSLPGVSDVAQTTATGAGGIAVNLDACAAPVPSGGGFGSGILNIGLPPDAIGEGFSLGDEETAMTQERFKTHETLTLTNLVAQHTTVPDQAIGLALITVAGDDCRFFLNGDDPTASVGHFAPANSVFQVAGFSNIANLSFIAATAGGSIVTISYARP